MIIDDSVALFVIGALIGGILGGFMAFAMSLLALRHYAHNGKLVKYGSKMARKAIKPEMWTFIQPQIDKLIESVDADQLMYKVGAHIGKQIWGSDGADKRDENRATKWVVDQIINNNEISGLLEMIGVLDPIRAMSQKNPRMALLAFRSVLQLAQPLIAKMMGKLGGGGAGEGEGKLNIGGLLSMIVPQQDPKK